MYVILNVYECYSYVQNLNMFYVDVAVRASKKGMYFHELLDRQVLIIRIII